MTSRHYNIKCFQQLLTVLGIFVFSYNLGNLIHESGHALNAVLSGGSVNRITLSPLSWCYASTSGGNRMFVVCGGFLWQTALPTVILVLLWCFKSRLSLWALFLALVSFAPSGIYMIIGAVAGIGDGGRLIKYGIPPFVLLTVGSILLLCCLPLALPLGPFLGVGRKQTSFVSTLLVLLPIQMYLFTMMIYNVVKNRSEKMWWVSARIGSIFATVGVSLVIHFFSNLVNSRSAKNLTMHICRTNAL